jgi:hypothetical protein
MGISSHPDEQASGNNLHNNHGNRGADVSHSKRRVLFSMLTLYIDQTPGLTYPNENPIKARIQWGDNHQDISGCCKKAYTKCQSI